MIHATEILSRFIAGMTYGDLPAEAVEQTKLFIADYYAACFAGEKVNAAFNRAAADTLTFMGGREEASVLFSDTRLPAMNAAFMNAVYAHGADMDDGNRKAMGHVGAHVMSAVFALAETLAVSGESVFTAINAGYEVYNRLAAAAQPGLVHRGFHSTGTAGAIACGAACAKLMGLDADGIYQAMSMSAIQSSGLIVIAESGQSCKPLNPANAARTGIFSALLAAKGVKSSVYPLESGKGWFHAMTDEIDESQITNGLGSAYTITESYIKPYPSCRHTHCGIEAALRIRERLLADGKSAADVRAVRVNIYDNAIKIAGQIRVPPTADDAKFSIHYSLATALEKGRFGLDDLDLSGMTEGITRLIDRIELIPDAAMEDRAAGIRGAKVTATLADGSAYEAQVLIPKGDAANPFTWADMADKMRACMGDKLGGAQIDGVIARVRGLDKARRFGSINDVLESGAIE